MRRRSLPSDEGQVADLAEGKILAALSDSTSGHVFWPSPAALFAQRAVAPSPLGTSLFRCHLRKPTSAQKTEPFRLGKPSQNALYFSFVQRTIGSVGKRLLIAWDQDHPREKRFLTLFVHSCQFVSRQHRISPTDRTAKLRIVILASVSM